MIGVDTNVLVRILMGDDPGQTNLARRLLNGASVEKPIFVGLIVLAETVWVLERVYNVPRVDVESALREMLDIEHLILERLDVVRNAVDAYAAGFGFSDALIGGVHTACGVHVTMTFDRDAAKLPHFELLR